VTWRVHTDHEIVQEALGYGGDYLPSATLRDEAKAALGRLVEARDTAQRELTAEARLERVEAAANRLYNDVTAQLEHESDSASSDDCAECTEVIERVRLAFGAPWRALGAALSDVTPPPSGAVGAVDE
jgi:hypothetical protein